VAVLLPGASAYLRETKMPPIELLRVNRVPIAVASDLNPGSSPLASLQLNMNLACTRFGLTTEEALLGVTRNAARALGLRKALGSIEPGKIADIVIWNAEHPAEQGRDRNVRSHLGPSGFQAWRILRRSLARSCEESGGG